MISKASNSSLSNHRNISDAFIKLNSNWAKPIYGTENFNYQFVNPQELPDLESKTNTTHYNLSKSDIELKDSIEFKTTIQQFLQRINIPKEETMNFNFKSIDKISRISKRRVGKQTNNFEISNPPPLQALRTRYLKIKINSITNTNLNKQVEISAVCGILFLYDLHKSLIASEPLYFTYKNKKAVFNHSNQDTAYIQCRKPNESLSLVCILTSCNAYPLDKFLDDLFPNSPQSTIQESQFQIPIPFALSYLNLFCLSPGQKDIQFPTSWLKFKNSSILKLIGNQQLLNNSIEPSNSEVAKTKTKSPLKTSSTPISSSNSSINNSDDDESNFLSSTDVDSNPMNDYSSSNSSRPTSGATPSNPSVNNTMNIADFEKTNGFVSINANVQLDLIQKIEDIPDYCMTYEINNQNKPLLAESFPPYIGCPSSYIALSNIKLLFNSTKKADFVFIRIFFCEDQSDLLKPVCSDKVLFIRCRDSDDSPNYYESILYPYSKEIYLSDFVKIMITQTPKVTSHFIIHVYLVLKGVRTLSRVCIIPLYEDVSADSYLSISQGSINSCSNSNLPINSSSMANITTSGNISLSTTPTNQSVNTSSLSLASTSLDSTIVNNSSTVEFSLPFSLQSKTKFSTTNLQNLRTVDYLPKLRPNSKTSIELRIDYPSLFFPPMVLQTFSKIDDPDKINLQDILRLDKTNIELHFIPIAAKLFSLMSEKSLLAFIELYSKCATNSIRTEFNSWIYHNFDSSQRKEFFISFTSSLEHVFELSMNDEHLELSPMILMSIDVITDIFLVSYIQSNELIDFPNGFLLNYSDLILFFVKLGKIKHFEYMKLTENYAKLWFYLQSFIKNDSHKQSLLKIIQHHMQSLVLIDKQYEISALATFFEFLIRLKFDTEFSLELIFKLPVRPLNEVYFLPFQPMLSLIIRAVYHSFSLDDKKLFEVSSEFLARLTIRLESFDEPSKPYRCAYALFPFLDIISKFYINSTNQSSKFELLTPILFLLRYTPSQLLKNYFADLSSDFKNQFVRFLLNCAETCVRQIDQSNDKITFYGISLFNDLTVRFIQFLRFIFHLLNDCKEAVFSLTAFLVSSPYQTILNFPSLFDITKLLLSDFGWNRKLLHSLVKLFASPQLIARGYATTSLALLFMRDFKEKKTVIESSVYFLDSFITIILNLAPDHRIGLFKQMILVVQSIIEDDFKFEALSSNLRPNLLNSKKMAEIIESIPFSENKQIDACLSLMEIANNFKSYPSIRLKCLLKITDINTKNGWYSSAFLSQLQACVLITTIYIHKNEIEQIYNSKKAQEKKTEELQDEESILVDFSSQMIKNLYVESLLTSNVSNSNNDPIPPDLLITQPFLTSLNHHLSDTDFNFIQSVMVEASLEYDCLSDDFIYVLNDFTIQLLTANLKQAILYGMKSQLFYSTINLLSILLRIVINEKNGREFSSIFKMLKECYKGLSLHASSIIDGPLSFYAKGDFVFCVDHGTQIEDSIPIKRYDRENFNFHIGSKFITSLTKADIELFKKENCDVECVQLTQYTTTHPLPRFTLKSEIILTKTYKYTLLSYTEMEHKRICSLIEQTASYFERNYPIYLTNECRNIPKANETLRLCISSDLNRITSILSFTFEGEMCLFKILKILSRKNLDAAIKFAQELRGQIERLMKVYHSFVELLMNPDQSRTFQKMLNLTNSFTFDFQLKKIDALNYELNQNPLSDVPYYEIY